MLLSLAVTFTHFDYAGTKEVWDQSMMNKHVSSKHNAWLQKNTISPDTFQLP